MQRWDQDTWDVSFPVIFANHCVALAIPILYYPSIFMCVMGWIHFGLFIALLVVNIFIRDLEPNGSRTMVSRIIWIRTPGSTQSCAWSTSCTSSRGLPRFRESSKTLESFRAYIFTLTS